jgi:DNA-binding NtrC family response regulator
MTRLKSPLLTGKGNKEKKRKNLIRQMSREAPTLNELVCLHEKEYIQKIVLDCAGNLVQASIILNVSRNTLKAKISKYKIKIPNA